MLELTHDPQPPNKLRQELFTLTSATTGPQLSQFLSNFPFTHFCRKKHTFFNGEKLFFFLCMVFRSVLISLFHHGTIAAARVEEKMILHYSLLFNFPTFGDINLSIEPQHLFNPTKI